MVVARHVDLRSPRISRASRVPGDGAHRVAAVVAGAGRVLVVADPVGHVLLEQATGRDRHDLHAAADAEHRQVELAR